MRPQVEDRQSGGRLLAGAMASLSLTMFSLAGCSAGDLLTALAEPGDPGRARAEAPGLQRSRRVSRSSPRIVAGDGASGSAARSILPDTGPRRA